MMKLAVAMGAVMSLAVACAEEAPPTTPGEFGATCSTVVDTGSTECASGTCSDAFDDFPTPVCSQTCQNMDGTNCPSGSQGKKCNRDGYCRP